MKPKQSLYNSFVFGFKGLALVLKERNFIIDLIFAAITIITSFILKISYLEWVSILICIALVLSLEAINTAIEKTIDLLHPQQHFKAGEVKDIAAGAVLIAAIISAVIGCLIFIPKIYDLVNT